MSKKVKRTIVNCFFLLAFSVIIIILFASRDADELWEILPYINVKMLLLTAAFFVLYYFVDGVSLWLMGHRYRQDYHYHEGLVVAWVGSFFSAITPSATGGQVGQAYVLRKQHLHLEQAANLLVLQWLAKELSAVVYCGATLILSYVLKLDTITKIHIFGFDMNFIIFAFIGFGIHVVATTSVLSLSYSHHTENFIFWILRVCRKFKIMKPAKYEENCGKVTAKLNRYREELKDMRKNWIYVVGAFLLELVRYTIYFAVPWLVSYVLNINLPISALMTSVIYASFVFLITAFIPLPGAAGGTEVFFAIVFASFYGSSAATTSALLIWRFVTFYVGLIIGLIVTAVYSRKKQVKLVEEALPEEPMIKINALPRKNGQTDNGRSGVTLDKKRTEKEK